MSLRVNVISNLLNEKGLWRDYVLLRDRLSGLGVEVTGVDFRDMEAPEADLTICLEVHRPKLLRGVSWLIPNQEWWDPAMNGELSVYERILTKSEMARGMFGALHARVEYLGWESEDRYDGAIGKRLQFLHIAGLSLYKGTQSVIEAWVRGNIQWPLVVISHIARPFESGNVRVIAERVSDEDLRRLQNESLVWLQPSEAEGFGHVIHEGRSCGAVVVTTDAAPMNEAGGTLRLKGEVFEKLGLSDRVRVDPGELAGLVAGLAQMGEAELLRFGMAARAGFLLEREEFAYRLRRLMGSLG